MMIRHDIVVPGPSGPALDSLHKINAVGVTTHARHSIVVYIGCFCPSFGIT